MQALGGTGGLRLGADLLRGFTPAKRVWISDPSWENHRALFENAGFTVETYPYIRDRGRALDFTGMIGCLSGLPAGDVVILHACCHNPTGLDLTPEQWAEVIEVVKARGLIPFLDIAYQGFAEGLDADAAPVRAFAAAGVSMLVSSSFSKSLSLYGERVGALSVVTSDAAEATRVLQPAEAAGADQLFQPALPRRQDRLRRAQHAGTPVALGRGTDRHARPHPLDARSSGARS